MDDALIAAADLSWWRHISPAVPMVLAGVVTLIVPLAVLRKILALLGIAGALSLWAVAEAGIYGRVEIAQFTLDTFRYDGLSRVFGLIFIVATALNTIYAWHDRDRGHDAAALVYAGAAVGGVFAGDLLTLFVCWELTALASVYLVMARGGLGAIHAGLRYLAIQVLSGVTLLAGAVVWGATHDGALVFGAAATSVGDAVGTGPFYDPTTLAGGLILFAFGIKAAFPLLHNWLADSYPRATPAGAVVLSAFTTKLAIYALARGFAGFEPLIYVGAVMAVFTAVFALASDDLRKTLAYSLNSQLGFMVVGIGIGTPLALNGAIGHAVVSVLYKGLLFMAMGAVLLRTDTTRASQLGGLYRTMPVTAVCCMIGAGAIAALPLFSGFVAKGMILGAALYTHYDWVWLALIVASAGALVHTALKVPYMAFFGRDSQRRPAEAPLGMTLAMAAAAFLCVYLALPLPAGWGGMNLLTGLLPYTDAKYVAYETYTTAHVFTQLQLVLAGAFVFAMGLRWGIYPLERGSLILDTDWVYRRLGLGLVMWGGAVCGRLWNLACRGVMVASTAIAGWSSGAFAPSGVLNKSVSQGALAIWAGIGLAVALIVAVLTAG